MPTGYTEALYNGEQSFEDFVLRASRGMGALITMRDASLDAEIPRSLKPSLSYNKRGLEEAKETLRLLDERSERELRLEYSKEKEARKRENRASAADTEARRIRYEEMIDEIRKTEFPEILASFKDFMLEQLQESAKFDCSVYNFPIPNKFEDWLDDKRAKAERDIQYHSEQIEKEIERTRDRNEWLDALWSLVESKKARELIS